MDKFQKNAIFPGSFDHFHEGHKEVLNQAIKLFDKIYILVSFNLNKKYSSKINERVLCVKNNIKEFKNIDVIFSENKLTAEIAKEYNCSYIIRGLRNSKDFEYELKLADANSYLNNELQTIFFITDRNKRDVSSTLIKEIKKIRQGKLKFEIK